MYPTRPPSTAKVADGFSVGHGKVNVRREKKQDLFPKCSKIKQTKSVR